MAAPLPGRGARQSCRAATAPRRKSPQHKPRAAAPCGGDSAPPRRRKGRSSARIASLAKVAALPEKARRRARRGGGAPPPPRHTNRPATPRKSDRCGGGARRGAAARHGGARLRARLGRRRPPWHRALQRRLRGGAAPLRAPRCAAALAHIPAYRTRAGRGWRSAARQRSPAAGRPVLAAAGCGRLRDHQAPRGAPKLKMTAGTWDLGVEKSGGAAVWRCGLQRRCNHGRWVRGGAAQRRPGRFVRHSQRGATPGAFGCGAPRDGGLCSNNKHACCPCPHSPQPVSRPRRREAAHLAETTELSFVGLSQSYFLDRSWIPELIQHERDLLLSHRLPPVSPLFWMASLTQPITPKSRHEPIF